MTQQESLRVRALALRGDREALAREIMTDELFWRVLNGAARQVLPRFPEGWREDILQEALMNLWDRLIEDELDGFSDKGEKAFAGWLFTLCGSYLKWAGANISRKEARRRYPGPRPVHAWWPELVYIRVNEAVAEVLAHMDDHLREALIHLERGLTVKQSAELMAVSERTVNDRRKQGLRIVRTRIEEALECVRL